MSTPFLNPLLWNLSFAMGLQALYLGWRVRAFRRHGYSGLALASAAALLDLVSRRIPASNPYCAYALIGLTLFGTGVLFHLLREGFRLYRENELGLFRLSAAHALLKERLKLRDIGFATTGINHDIRNFSATLRNNAYLLGSKDPENRNKRAVIQVAESLSRMAEKLGLETSALRPDFFGLRLTEAIQSAANRFHGKMEFDVDPFPGENPLSGDALELDRVFHNLFQNSWEAGATRIWIAFQPGENGLDVVVRDNGKGDHRFDTGLPLPPFQSSKRNQGGTGIGMALIRDILGRHGADLRVRNAGAGEPRGVEVTLMFPWSGTDPSPP